MARFFFWLFSAPLLSLRSVLQHALILKENKSCFDYEQRRELIDKAQRTPEDRTDRISTQSCGHDKRTLLHSPLRFKHKQGLPKEMLLLAKHAYMWCGMCVWLIGCVVSSWICHMCSARVYYFYTLTITRNEKPVRHTIKEHSKTSIVPCINIKDFYNII